MLLNATKQGLFQRTLNLTTGSYYVHLVTTAIIDPTLTTVSQIALATGGNYQPYGFPGVPSLSVSSDGTAAIATFGNMTWTNLATDGSANLQGTVLCRQVGSSPANTDPILCYNALPTPFTPSGASLILSAPDTGVLRLVDGEGLIFAQTLLGLLNRTLDLTTGTFYGHLVTTAPIDPLANDVADLALPTGGNYAPVILTGLGFGTNANRVIWRSDDPQWNGLTVNNPATNRIRGMVVCKRVGASFAASDPIVCYKPLSATQFPNGYTANGATFAVEVNPTTDGLLRL